MRLQTEVAIRRAFLDRRECVEGNLLLRFARDQEVRWRISIKHIVCSLRVFSCSTNHSMLLCLMFHQFCKILM